LFVLGSECAGLECSKNGTTPVLFSEQPSGTSERWNSIPKFNNPYLVDYKYFIKPPSKVGTLEALARIKLNQNRHDTHHLHHHLPPDLRCFRIKDSFPKRGNLLNSKNHRK
jgi:hypothetical protein